MVNLYTVYAEKRKIMEDLLFKKPNLCKIHTREFDLYRMQSDDNKGTAAQFWTMRPACEVQWFEYHKPKSNS